MPRFFIVYRLATNQADQPAFFASLLCPWRFSGTRDTGFGTTLTGVDISPRVEVFDDPAGVAGKGWFGETNCTNTSPSLTMPIS